jgi:hypothetical protein
VRRVADTHLPSQAILTQILFGATYLFGRNVDADLLKSWFFTTFPRLDLHGSKAGADHDRGGIEALEKVLVSKPLAASDPPPNPPLSCLSLASSSASIVALSHTQPGYIRHPLSRPLHPPLKSYCPVPPLPHVDSHSLRLPPSPRLVARAPSRVPSGPTTPSGHAYGSARLGPRLGAGRCDDDLGLG